MSLQSNNETVITRVDPESHGIVAQTKTFGAFALAAGEGMSLFCGLGHANSQDEVLGHALIITKEVAALAPQAHPGLQRSVDPVNGEIYFSTIKSWPDSMPDPIECIRVHRHNLLAARRGLSRTERLQRSPMELTTRGAISAIAWHDPANTLYLTGAGMSANQVWTHEVLTRRAGFENQAKKLPEYFRNQTFIEEFLEYPEKATAVKSVFEQHMQQNKTSSTTPAHEAFSRLMGALHDKPLVATLSQHVMHENAGVAVPHLVHKTQESYKSSSEDERRFGEILKKRAESIALIVALGVSADVKETIAYVRSQNPAVTVLACNLNDKLPYLSDQDYLIQADCQQFLPEVADSLG